MSFFDDTKNVGLLLLIIALIGVVMTVISCSHSTPTRTSIRGRRSSYWSVQ